MPQAHGKPPFLRVHDHHILAIVDALQGQFLHGNSQGRDYVQNGGADNGNIWRGHVRFVQKVQAIHEYANIRPLEEDAFLWLVVHHADGDSRCGR